MTAASEKLLKICVTALSADAQGGTPVDESHIETTIRLFAPIVGPGLSEEDIVSVKDEITRRLNVWTGSSSALIGNDPGHLAWLTGRKSEIKWRFWDRYKLYMQARIPEAVVTELDAASDKILDYLEDPSRAGSWRRQGLVVGHVQSGKTGNYTGLVCKAADAGYKVIVILSGIHNSLRAQTQIRLDEGFLGYARRFDDSSSKRVPVGVGLQDGSVIADSMTTRDENGDFSKVKAQGTLIHAGGTVLLFVVKKNVRVLRNLIEWAALSAKKPLAEGRMVVADVPLLIIDDEADQASIDLNHQPIDPETGQPDVDHDPSTINRLIRQLLETFERRAYVGYTATPFANVFIHRKAQTPDLGDDLFPKHFIVNLTAPSDYFGPVRVFGASDDDRRAQGAIPSRIRHIVDTDSWIPASHKATVVPRVNGANRVPPSLDEAVRSFILTSAARRARGQVNEHKSMLVHVTRFTAVQEHVYRQIDQLVADLKVRWRSRKTSGSDSLSEELQRLWESDIAATSEMHGGAAPAWSKVEPEIWPIFERLRVNLINAKASDALIYEEHKEQGLHVIAVGGDKLSRGLTLEGLTVSYFLRSARMYDTLMQMGRWFGYRPGYEDLCRLYLSPELAEWYGHIADASDELRQEFDRMVLLGGTPDDYGLRVRTHPALLVSGRLRPGTKLWTTSLSATPFEPTVLVEEAEPARANWSETLRLVRDLGQVSEFPVSRSDEGLSNPRGRWPGAAMWSGVPGSTVLAFLNRFAFADRFLVRTPGATVRKYIAGRLDDGELRDWSVVLMGKSASRHSGKVADGTAEPIAVPIAGSVIYSIYRQRVETGDERAGKFYVAQRVGSPMDEQIDLSMDEKMAVERDVNTSTPDPARAPSLGSIIRHNRPAQRGLLILYLLTPDKSSAAPDVPIVAPYVSFPHTDRPAAVDYLVDELYWQNEIRGVE
jgi:hypothetical protein